MRERVVGALQQYYLDRSPGWELIDFGVRMRDLRAYRAHAAAARQKLQREILSTSRRAAAQEIVFPVAARPMVTVLIQADGNRSLLRECLGSLCVAAPVSLLEIVVRADHSAVDTMADIRSIPGVRILSTRERDAGFDAPGSGATAPAGEYVLFLSGDTLILPGFVLNLLETMRDPTIGIVAPKIVSRDGLLESAGRLIWQDGSASSIGAGGNASAAEYSFRREVDACASAAFMIRSDLLRAIGQQDLRIAGQHGSEAELCWATTSRGLRVVFEPASIVARNAQREDGLIDPQFAVAHQTELREHLPRPADPSSRGTWGSRQTAKPRVLVCDWIVPASDRDSGSNRMDGLLRLLVPMSSWLTFLPRLPGANLEYAAHFRRQGIEVLVPPPPSATRFLDSRRGFYDLAILSRPDVAKDLLGAVRRLQPQATVVFDTVDLQSVRLQRELETNRSSTADPEAARRIERTLISGSDYTVTVTDVEAQAVGQLVPGARTVILPNIHDARSTNVPPFAARRGLMFIGTYWYNPNVDAVVWFANEILPRIRRQLDVELLAVGVDYRRSVLVERCGQGVRFTGWVPTVTPLFDEARVFVAPLRFGAGMKGKIGQAMALGLPVVTTTIGAEGMDLTDGENVLIRDDAASFADAVLELHENEHLWGKLSSAAIDVVRNRWSSAVMGARLRQLLAEAANAR